MNQGMSKNARIQTAQSAIPAASRVPRGACLVNMGNPDCKLFVEPFQPVGREKRLGDLNATTPIPTSSPNFFANTSRALNTM